MYYVNTWNQEVRWTKPLEMSLFETGGDRPGTGNTSKLSDDDDDGGGGADSISGRFRQRLVELTGEATLAAEEEAAFHRYVAANIAAITETINNVTVNKSNGTVKSDGKIEGSGDKSTREALALAAAREWRFVSTDGRLLPPSTGADPSTSNTKKTKCWYRAETSEYYWGDHPPLLGLLPRLDLDLRGPGRRKAAPSSGDDSGGDRGLGRCSSEVDGASGATRSGDRDAGLPGTFHPNFGVVFADRASGESWLRAQDVGALLARSEKVCDIGPAGWRQLRAREGRGEDEDEDGDDDEPASRPVLDAAGSSASATVSAMTENSGSASATAAAAEGAAAPADVSPNGGEKKTSSTPGASPPPFTFFHHAEAGEVRWCLSPRSALRVPRTPRREAAYEARQAAAAAAAAAAHHPGEEHQQQGWDGDGAAGAEGGFGSWGADQADGGTLALVGRDGSGDSWEMVEDGDVVFYYNKRLGESSWEPPPGWAQDAGQEQSFGAGG